VKKLLLLLIIPFLSFGQNNLELDVIIFSTGDTIYGNVVEVGNNNITYSHKLESTKNIVNQSKIAKILFFSGRVEEFGGLKILELNKKNEQATELKKKEQNERLKEKQIKEELRSKRKEQRNLKFKRHFEVGLLFGANSSNIVGMEEWFDFVFNSALGYDWEFNYNGETVAYSDVYEKVSYEEKVDYSTGILIQYNHSKRISFKGQLLYHKKGAVLNNFVWAPGSWWITPTSTADSALPPLSEGYLGMEEVSYRHDYISLPLSIQFNFGHKFRYFLNSGFYTAYCIQSVDKLIGPPEFLDFLSVSGGSYHRDDGNGLLNQENYNKLDFGFVLGGGGAYSLNKYLKLSFETSLHLGLKSLNKDWFAEDFSDLKSRNRSFNLLLGFSYSFKK